MLLNIALIVENRFILHVRNLTPGGAVLNTSSSGDGLCPSSSYCLPSNFIGTIPYRAACSHPKQSRYGAPPEGKHAFFTEHSTKTMPPVLVLCDAAIYRCAPLRHHASTNHVKLARRAEQFLTVLLVRIAEISKILMQTDWTRSDNHHHTYRFCSK